MGAGPVGQQSEDNPVIEAFRLGMFDVDDLINNTIGAGAEYLLFDLCISGGKM